MSLFMILEKVNPMVFTAQTLTPNHYVIFMPSNWYYTINLCLKNEVFYSFCKFLEMSAIDTLKYGTIFPKNEFINRSKRFLVYNIYYCYYTKIRITIVQTSPRRLPSLDRVFRNASWMEREVSEMFGVNFVNKRDSRSLLLDYSRNEHPMLKDFPCEGHQDIYYNLFEEKLTYVDHDYIEL